jgi:hypothetical protein
VSKRVTAALLFLADGQEPHVGQAEMG